jgi:hypothetical protein
MRILSGVLILGFVVGASYAAAQAKLTAADYPAKMKAVAQANQALQMKLKNNQATEAAADAKALAGHFADIAAFWKGQNKADAVMWATSAQQGFTEAAAAAAAGDAMKAQMAAGNALANCKMCHGMYREGNPQEGFKFKAGAVTE